MVGAGDDPNKRLPMYWNDTDMTALPPGVTKVEYAYPCLDEQLADPASLLNYCRAVNLARRKSPAIARGKNETLFSNELTCLMRRTLEDDACYIAINCSSKSAQTVTLPDAHGRIPVIASSSSLCPLPSMAAMPRISPARTDSDSRFTASSPRLSKTVRSRTAIRSSPGVPVFSSCS